MRIDTVTNSLNDLKHALEEKGATNVNVEFKMDSDGPHFVHMSWRHVTNDYESFWAYRWDNPTAHSMIEACAERISRIPEADFARMTAAYNLLAEAKKKFNKLGIEEDFTNPIEDLMKKLSSKKG